MPAGGGAAASRAHSRRKKPGGDRPQLRKQKTSVSTGAASSFGWLADESTDGTQSSGLAVREAAGSVPELKRSGTQLREAFKATRHRRSSGGQFLDVEDMKSRIRETLTSPQYDVTDFFKTTGLWQKIARHPVFDNFTMVIIMVNAVFIAVDTDRNHAPTLLEAHPFFQIAEHFFCTYFSFEWFTRFMAFRFKRDCFKDGWFVFDTCLVSMMVLETWVMTIVLVASSSSGGAGLGQASILRLFRLLRLTRITRLMRMIPELMILCKGMVAGMRSVFTVMCLLMVVMYVFAIAFTQLADGKPYITAYFPDVGLSLYSLLIHGVFLDSLEAITRVLEQDPPCLILFFLFVLLSALTIMNMLIGVLCEVVSAVSKAEKDGIHVNNVYEKLQKILTELDSDGSESISRQEFVTILGHPEVTQALVDVDVDPVGIVDFADYIFDSTEAGADGTDEISFEDFMQLVLSLRGSNHVTVKDVVDLRKHILGALEKLEAEVLKSATASSSRLSLSFSDQGCEPGAFGGGGGAVRGEDVRRLEEKVGRAEGLLVALSSEVRRLGERLPGPPAPTNSPQGPWEGRRPSWMLSESSRGALLPNVPRSTSSDEASDGAG